MMNIIGVLLCIIVYRIVSSCVLCIVRVASYYASYYIGVCSNAYVPGIYGGI
jgi:hypothetical protein